MSVRQSFAKKIGSSISGNPIAMAYYSDTSTEITTDYLMENFGVVWNRTGEPGVKQYYNPGSHKSHTVFNCSILKKV